MEAFETPEALISALSRDLEPFRRDDQPICELRLTGVLNFDRQDLDLARIQQTAETIVRPLLCQIQDHTRSNAYEFRTDEQMSRQELERRVLTEIVENDIRRRPQAALWADAALRIKQLALDGADPPAIIEILSEVLETKGRDDAPQEQA